MSSRPAIRLALPVMILLATGCSEVPRAQSDAPTAAPTQARPASPSSLPHSSAPPVPASALPNACQVQDGRAVPAETLQALGTEPFWGAAVEGRCVTWTTPEDPRGQRLWTRFEQSGRVQRWRGALGGNTFIMEITPQPGCSDGMSDNVYPLAATVVIGAQRLAGCARAGGNRPVR